ncbi:MAG TPA: carboxypeptidase-like regulatory domain-containing protein [Bacteroidia bacterium]|nr:carboxypeptidase-like regulatory domain-containing protein [Bacteroidia bacterium]
MIRNFLTGTFVLTLLFSCSNGPGPGGKASITGKVKMVNRWDANCLEQAQPFDTYYAPDVDVYVIFGDDPSYGDRVKTGPDGTYWFQYLRPGKYTVYAYSKDCSLASSPGVIAMKKEVEIQGKKDNVSVADLILEK